MLHPDLKMNMDSQLPERLTGDRLAMPRVYPYINKPGAQCPETLQTRGRTVS